MEVYLFDQPRFQQLYNCTFYNVNSLSLEERTHKFWGWFFLVCYSMFMMLYIPCLWAMCISNWRHGASYKLMIQLGFTQMIGLQFAGPFTGILSIRGIVFCSAPVFEYIACCFACSHWIVTTTTCDILGINRVCELYSSEFAFKLFGGKKLWLWMAFPVVYGSIACWYMRPNLYNSQMMAYFSNPHYGYADVIFLQQLNMFLKCSLKTKHDPNNIYMNNLFAVHNVIICFTETCIYILMPLLYFRATRMVTSDEFRARIRYDRQIYIQVIFVGLINFMTSLVYIIIQQFPLTFSTTLTATIGYLFSQGMTSVVYLCINRSIRPNYNQAVRNFTVLCF
ncbi:hypothetical protein M3Y97_01096200 [Aphelenchoides bicaudatus]|nr:hypothetical protein M3Y97_01096200 [Aphelenchoides bicaudatus]